MVTIYLLLLLFTGFLLHAKVLELCVDTDGAHHVLLHLLQWGDTDHLQDIEWWLEIY